MSDTAIVTCRGCGGYGKSLTNNKCQECGGKGKVAKCYSCRGLQAENEKLVKDAETIHKFWVALKEIVDVQNNAGPVCGKCHSQLGRYERARQIASTAMESAKIETTEPVEAYCRDCGYLSSSRVTNSETCDTCHKPIEWHDAEDQREVQKMAITIRAKELQIKALKELLAENMLYHDHTCPAGRLDKTYGPCECPAEERSLKDAREAFDDAMGAF